MTQRYYSLDVFRGATVAFMILVNNPGSWSHLYSPLGHAAWHGLTPTDLVFPFFLFAVGNAMAFVMPRLMPEGDGAFWKKVVTRTALIFLIGLFLNWFPFVQWQDNELVFKSWTYLRSNGEPGGIRILGVLQRIALCYFFASVLIYYAKAKGAALLSAGMLLLYWILCVVGNPADPYSLSGWFGTSVDKLLFGDAHLYHGEGVAFDPEGLVSTLPSIVQVIIGFLVGDYIRQRGQQTSSEAVVVKPIYQTLTILFVTSMLLLFAGYAWGLTFPINKKIWTSSFVLVTSGLAIAVLSMLIYGIEVKNSRGYWSRFFDVFGKNPLFIYALSGVIPRLLGLVRIPDGLDEAGNTLYTSPLGWFYDHIAAKVPGPAENGSLFYAICMVMFLWAIGYWLDKKKLYLRV